MSKYEHPVGAGAACAGVAVMVRPPRVTALVTVMVLMSCVNFMPSLSGTADHLGMSKRAHSAATTERAMSSARCTSAVRRSSIRDSSSSEPGAKLPMMSVSAVSSDVIENLIIGAV